MPPKRVIAIFDIGKTNKKLFLFDQSYKIVYERTAEFRESIDEDGFPCEGLDYLKEFVFKMLQEVNDKKEFSVQAINFSTYGASLVYLDKEFKVTAPLYSYLKPFPNSVNVKFNERYGDDDFLSRTGSPALGNLNSGMQIYRIKIENFKLYKRIKYALHLPQYLSFLLTKKCASDVTSVGCHTSLWDFNKFNYHDWVKIENIDKILPALLPSDHVETISLNGKIMKVGIGLHDTSAALIPYLINFTEPFILISTGTWCISLSPDNTTPLSKEELENDCVCYITFKGKPVKASRLFAGQDHEDQTKRIAHYFNLNSGWYKNIPYDPQIFFRLHKGSEGSTSVSGFEKSRFHKRDLGVYISVSEAYHQLILDIVIQQVASTKLVLGDNIKRIFVDGGFSKNAIYMNMLTNFFEGIEVFAASMAQATALGAALAIHDKWNKESIPSDIIELKYYSLTHTLSN